jgi:hypothetical protein
MPSSSYYSGARQCFKGPADYGSPSENGEQILELLQEKCQTIRDAEAKHPGSACRLMIFIAPYYLKGVPIRLENYEQTMIQQVVAMDGSMIVLSPDDVEPEILGGHLVGEFFPHNPEFTCSEALQVPIVNESSFLRDALTALHQAKQEREVSWPHQPIINSLFTPRYPQIPILKFDKFPSRFSSKPPTAESDLSSSGSSSEEEIDEVNPMSVSTWAKTVADQASDVFSATTPQLEGSSNVVFDSSPPSTTPQVFYASKDGKPFSSGDYFDSPLGIDPEQWEEDRLVWAHYKQKGLETSLQRSFRATDGTPSSSINRSL